VICVDNRRIRRVGIAVAGLSAVLALAACSSGNSSGSGVSFVSGDGTITYVAAQDRPQPVNLTGTTLDGVRLDSAGYRGHVLVVNIWGSWCSPCRAEAPALEAAYRQLKGSGVAFVGIDTRDDAAAQAKAFQQQFGVSYPSIVDNGGSVLLSLRGAASPKAVPTTLILDRQGRVAARVNGPVDKATLIGLVQDVQSGHSPKGKA
jgi:thiol-disulfide isomerase/thioredoxin